MITSIFCIALIVAVAIHAIRETMPETDKPGASTAGLPPYAPDNGESPYSARSVHDLAAMVVPTPPMMPFVNDIAQQMPIRRPQHNYWAAMEAGSGDAGWMYAAAEAARAQQQQGA
jgi:hypothetical protein